jgi:hypothetical protein
MVRSAGVRMQFDPVIQQALKDVHGLLVANTAPPRDLSDDRTVICLKAVLGKENVRRALEKANDTALCFALREVKHVLSQRQRAKTTINQLWRIIEQLDCAPGIKRNSLK